MDASLDQEDFASAWVQLWRELCGSVTTAADFYDQLGVDPDTTGRRGPIMLGTPETLVLAEYAGCPVLDVEPHLQIMTAAQWDGAFRALVVLAKAIPNGIAAIHKFVAEEQSVADFGGSQIATWKREHPDSLTSQKPLTAQGAAS